MRAAIVPFFGPIRVRTIVDGTIVARVILAWAIRAEWARRSGSFLLQSFAIFRFQTIWRRRAAGSWTGFAVSWRSGSAAGGAIGAAFIETAGPAIVAAIRISTEAAIRGILRPGENDRPERLPGNRFSGHKRAARLRFYFQRGAKRGDFIFDKQAVAALRQSFEVERAESDALEFFDGMFFGEEHAAKDVLAGILQGGLIPKIFGVAAAGVRLANGANDGVGVAAQTLQIGHEQATFDFYVIDLLKIGPVFEHFGGEVAIVREKNEAAGVVIETADGIDALGQAAEKIPESLAAFGIGHSGDDFGRLVEHEIDATLVGFDKLAGGFDAVFGGVRFAAQFSDHLAVNTDLAADDELLGVAAGSDTGAGDNFLEAFEHGWCGCFRV
jgi:hypothetical protein